MDAMPDKRGGPPRPGRHDGPGGGLDRRDPYVASVPEAAKLLGISKDLPTTLRSEGSCPGLSGWGAAGASASSGFAQPCTGLKTALGMMTTDTKPRRPPSWATRRRPQRAGP